jgi:hypothetical protein
MVSAHFLPAKKTAEDISVLISFLFNRGQQRIATHACLMLELHYHNGDKVSYNSHGA